MVLCKIRFFSCQSLIQYGHYQEDKFNIEPYRGIVLKLFFSENSNHCVFHVHWKSKMALTARHSFNIEPYGKREK
jgi:hypothetical protein